MGVSHCRVCEPPDPDQERKKSPLRHLRPPTDHRQWTLQPPPGQTLHAYLHQTTARSRRILPTTHLPPPQQTRLRTPRSNLHAIQPSHPPQTTHGDHQTHHRGLRRNLLLRWRRRKRILHQPLTELHQHRTHQRDPYRDIWKTRVTGKRISPRGHLPLRN